MSRGVSWVKFLAKLNRIKPGETGSESAVRLHADWIRGRRGPNPFGCGDATVQRFNFDDDKAVFTFKTEPYSTKSNDCFRYMFEFGRWVDEACAAPERHEPLLDLVGSGLTVSWNPPSVSKPKPTVEIKSEMEVRSFISRIVNQHTV